MEFFLKHYRNDRLALSLSLNGTETRPFIASSRRLSPEPLLVKRKREDDEESPDTFLSLALPGNSIFTTKSCNKKMKTVKEDESFLALTLRCPGWDEKSSRDDVASSTASSSMPIPEKENRRTNNPAFPEGELLLLNPTPIREIRNPAFNPALNNDDWDIKKRLEESDVNSLCRLLLSRTLVKDHILPHWDENNVERLSSEGVEVTILDTDTMVQSQLLFKLWKNKCYVFVRGWSREFVKRRHLKKGDTIGLHWDGIHSRFNFSVLDRSR